MPEGPAGGPRPFAESSITLKIFKLTGEFTRDEVANIEQGIRDKQDTRADVTTTEDEFGMETVLLITMPTPRASASSIMKTIGIVGNEINEDIENHNVIVFSDKSYT